MKITLLLLILAFGFAGCAPHAAVMLLPPPREGTTDSPPLTALDRYVEAADRAWRKLNGNPADPTARNDYNFAIARICGTLRESKLTP